MLINKFYQNNDYERQWIETINEEEYRTPFRRDYARLVHSPSFRRLTGKTQLFPGFESDFFRNRLTHSMEVAQVGKSIALRINWILREKFQPQISNEYEIDTDLIEFACLAHDIGHPPFGHQGEDALNEMMKEYGGFEGNAQTLRILVRLEKKFNGLEDHLGVDKNAKDWRYGLNLTHRAIASIIKYDNKIPIINTASEANRIIKGFYEIDEELVKNIRYKITGDISKTFKTVECQIMDIADDIAYSVFDLEDSLKGGFITPLDMLNTSPEVRNKLAEKISDKKIARASDVLIQKTIVGIENYPKVSSDKKTHLIESLRSRDVQSLETVPKELKLKYKSGIIDHLLGEIISKVIVPSVDVNSQGFLTEKKDGEEYIRASLAEYISKLTHDNSKLLTNCGYDRLDFTSKLINQFIRSVNIHYNEENPVLSEVFINNEGNDGNHDAELKIEILKRFTYHFQINSSKLKIVEFRGREIVKVIFKAILDNGGNFLPSDYFQIYEIIEKKYYDPLKPLNEEFNRDFQIHRHRLICDYVSSMTDKYATEFYNRLNAESPQTIFKGIW